jgi:hypothetical protein
VAGRTPPPGATGDAKVKITTGKADGSVGKQMSDEEIAESWASVAPKSQWERDIERYAEALMDPDASPEPDAYTEHHHQ